MREGRTYRAWRPGDGLVCSLSGRAAQGVPCGPPVLVGDAPFAPVGRRASRRKELLCETHVAARFTPGGIGALNAELDREARESVLAAHWDEYQAEREKRRPAMVDAIAAAVPDEYRHLIEQAVAAMEANDDV